MGVITWEGIRIEVRHAANWLHTGYDHIELRADEPLPVTTTGYRSHFLASATLAQFDSAEDFVLQWLTAQADDPAWQEARAARRQLSLF